LERLETKTAIQNTIMNLLIWLYIVTAAFFLGIGVADNLSIIGTSIRDYLIVAVLSAFWPITIIVGLINTYV
jgi:hypothetical protein